MPNLYNSGTEMLCCHSIFFFPQISLFQQVVIVVGKYKYGVIFFGFFDR
jgi:hypothetical protein